MSVVLAELLKEIAMNSEAARIWLKDFDTCRRRAGGRLGEAWSIFAFWESMRIHVQDY